MVSACNKPDSNPELKDPVFNDIQADLSVVSTTLEAELKNLQGFEKELAEVVPQTGQIKYARKRVNESKEKINRLEQEKIYLGLKLEARMKESKKSYLKAFKTGEAWPNPNEWESYRTEKRLRNAKRTWDAKNRIQELELEQGKSPEPPSGAH